MANPSTAANDGVDHSIGGFFGLELSLSPGHDYHHDLVRVNSGRNALHWLLALDPPRRVLLPRYSCTSLVAPLIALNIPYDYYTIDATFTPSVEAQPGDALLYINYFGLHDPICAQLTQRYPRVIIDNCQAFFSPPISTSAAIYSPRKFFGVPDGGYAFSPSPPNTSPSHSLPSTLPPSISHTRCTHLLKRLDATPEAAYPDFQAAELSLASFPVNQMSKLTQSLLAAIDYAGVAERRRENFAALHAMIGQRNTLTLGLPDAAVPMIYPLLVHRSGLREHLRQQRIYTATYWPEVAATAAPGSFEQALALYLVALPIDQRYGAAEIARVAAAVSTFLDAK